MVFDFWVEVCEEESFVLVILIWFLSVFGLNWVSILFVLIMLLVLIRILEILLEILVFMGIECVGLRLLVVIVLVMILL